MSMYDESVKVARRTMVLFFVVDTSGSMGGSKIGAVNTAISEVAPEIAKLSADNADAEIKVAVLSFSNGAQWITPQPIEAENFRWNDLNAGGMTDFGAACKALSEKLSRNAFMKEASGSYAPAIFLLSDGAPTDEYQKDLAALKQNKWFHKALKAALAIGDEADKDVLAEFTGNSETVIETHTTADLINLIKFVSVTSSQVGSKSSAVSSESGNSSAPSKMDDFAAAISSGTADVMQAGAIADDFD